MRTQQAVDPEALRFRGATLDEAVELAEQSLGPRARVVAANHIRRGGIGGFFASDLGVEVSVVLDEETIEAALDRIVEETAMHEREKWRDRDDVPASTTSFAAALRLVEDAPVVTPVVSAPVVSVPVLPPRVVSPRVPSAPAVSAPVVSVPVLPPRVVSPRVPSAPAVSVPVVPATTPSLGSRMERLEAAFASLRAGDAPVPVPARTSVTVPSRRQVELVVAAADQLVESICRHGAADHLSVRVLLRGSTGSEIAVEAHWGDADADADRVR